MAGVSADADRLAELIRLAQEDGSLEARMQEAVGDQTSPNQGELTERQKALQKLNIGNPLLQALNFPRQLLEDLDAGEGGIVERTTAGALQGLTMGGLGRLASATETIEQGFNGNFLDFDEAAQNRARYQGIVDDNANIGGEIAGAVLTGAGAGRAALEGAKQGIPRLFNYMNTTFLGRMSATAGMSAAEAAIYSLNAGKDLDDAQTDALLAMGLGGVGSGLIQILGPGFAAASKKLGFQPDRSAATDLLESIRLNNGEATTIGPRGEVLIDEDYLIRQAQQFGNDANLVDIIPDSVAANVASLLGTRNPKIYDASLPLVRMLQNRAAAAQPEFAATISQILGRDGVRTAAEVATESRELREQLSTQYGQVLQTAADNGVTFKASNMRRIVQRAFKGYDVPATNEIRDHLLDMIGPATTTHKHGRNTITRDRVMSPQELLLVRQALDGVIYTGRMDALGTRQAKSNIDNVTRTQFMQPVRDGIRRAMTTRIAGLGALDQAYSSDAVNSAAYDAGATLFRARVPDRGMFDVFMSDPGKTPAQMENFLEGVKAELFKKLDGKVTPRQIQTVLDENRASFDALEAVLNPTQVDQLRNSIARYAMAVNTGNMVQTAPATFNPDRGPFQSMFDALLIGSGASNIASKAGAFGAARRSVGGLTPPGALGEASAMSSLLSMPADQAGRAINAEVQGGLPLIMNYYPGWAGAFSAYAAGGGE